MPVREAMMILKKSQQHYQLEFYNLLLIAYLMPESAKTDERVLLLHNSY